MARVDEYLNKTAHLLSNSNAQGSHTEHGGARPKFDIKENAQNVKSENATSDSDNSSSMDAILRKLDAMNKRMTEIERKIEGSKGQSSTDQGISSRQRPSLTGRVYEWTGPRLDGFISNPNFN